MHGNLKALVPNVLNLFKHYDLNLKLSIAGFAGYFDSVLYKDIHLGIEPSTATPDMFSW